MRFPRTIIFVDLSGFTEYIETRGDAAGVELLHRFRRIARDLAAELGVRIDKFLGDGFMAISVEPDSGIVLATELRRRTAGELSPLKLRIGIASGDTMLFDGDDYIGTAPNLAARLCDEATEFGILIPSDQTAALPRGVRAESIGKLRLRGFPRRIAVSALRGDAEVLERNDTGELWTRAPFPA
jgi:adenylate cyclase